MSGTAYKILGFLVWKGVVSYARYRYGTTVKRAGAGALAAAVVAGAIVVAQRRDGGSSPG